jgi:hypothetical protein
MPLVLVVVVVALVRAAEIAELLVTQAALVVALLVAHRELRFQEVLELLVKAIGAATIMRLLVIFIAVKAAVAQAHRVLTAHLPMWVQLVAQAQTIQHGQPQHLQALVVTTQAVEAAVRQVWLCLVAVAVEMVMALEVLAEAVQALVKYQPTLRLLQEQPILVAVEAAETMGLIHPEQMVALVLSFCAIQVVSAVLVELLFQLAAIPITPSHLAEHTQHDRQRILAI